MSRSPIFANDDILEQFGCRKEFLETQFGRPAKENPTTGGTVPRVATNEPTRDCVQKLIHPSGWIFSAHHTKILSEGEILKLSQELKHRLSLAYPSFGVANTVVDDDHVQVGDCKLHLPPMLFGNDIFTLCHGDEVLSINAGDALMSWIAQHVEEETKNQPLDIVKVPFADKWEKRKVPDISALPLAKDESSTARADANTTGPGITNQTSPLVSRAFAFDWTYTSDYCISLLSSSPSLLSNSLSNANPSQARESERLTVSERIASSFFPKVQHGIVLRARNIKDLAGQTIRNLIPLKPSVTGRNDVQASVALASVEAPVPRDKEKENDSNPSPLPPPSATTASASATTWQIQQTTHSGIDYEMLKRRDEPILFYDEFVVYQDDLEDCGEVGFEVKLRVMPSCWFVLSKHTVRVDGALSRCRETRLFHRFGSTPSVECTIEMEVCWRELRASPALPEEPVTLASQQRVPPSGHSPSPLLSAAIIPPRPPPPSPPTQQSIIERKLLSPLAGKELTHLLPLINDKECIPQFYSLYLGKHS